MALVLERCLTPPPCQARLPFLLQIPAIATPDPGAWLRAGRAPAAGREDRAPSRRAAAVSTPVPCQVPRVWHLLRAGHPREDSLRPDREPGGAGRAEGPRRRPACLGCSAGGCGAGRKQTARGLGGQDTDFELYGNGDREPHDKCFECVEMEK